MLQCWIENYSVRNYLIVAVNNIFLNVSNNGKIIVKLFECSQSTAADVIVSLLLELNKLMENLIVS